MQLVRSRQFALATVLISGLTTLARGQSLSEFEPYQVQLVIASARQPELSGPFTARLIEGLTECADAYIGAAWNLNAIAADETLAARALHSLANVTKEMLPEGWRARDKIMLVRVEYTNGQYAIACREFDVLTEQWQAVLSRGISQQALLAEEVFRAVLATFAPVAEIDSADGKTAQLRWRAGALRPRDPNLSLMPAGLVMRPFVRLLDREGKTRKVQAIDWTFLITGQSEGGRGAATIYTGLRGALGGKKRGRVQQLALAVRCQPAVSRLALLARTEDARPLAGYEVYAHPPENPKTALVGHTDRDGHLNIPPDAAPLRVLIIKNGNELLARVPIVPGMQPQVTLRLPDDAPRLAAESFIIGLQERLVDVVVRRHVLIARIKLRINEGKLDEATRLMDELRRLDSQPQFLSALDLEKQKAITSDPVVQRKIDRMFADAHKLIGQYLDPRELSRAEIDLDSARRGQAAAPAPAQTSAN